jgi:hypothetical protein
LTGAGKLDNLCRVDKHIVYRKIYPKNFLNFLVDFFFAADMIAHRTGDKPLVSSWYAHTAW